MKIFKFNEEKLIYEQIDFFPHMVVGVLMVACLIFAILADKSASGKLNNTKIKIYVSRSNIEHDSVEVSSVETPKEMFIVSGTYYNVDSTQCEGDPTVTADGSIIDLQKLNSGDIRWVALSRNLLKRWGGRFDFGDKIKVEHKDSRIAGIWTVRDCTAARHHNHIDFLIPKGKDFAGRTRNIKISKL